MIRKSCISHIYLRIIRNVELHVTRNKMTSIKSLSAMLFMLVSTPSFADLSTYTEHDAFQAAVARGVTTPLAFKASVEPFDYFTVTYNEVHGSSTGVVDSMYNATTGDNYLAADSGAGFLSGADFILPLKQTWQAIGLYLISSDELFELDAVHNAGASNVSNAASTASTLTDDGLVSFWGLTDINCFTSASLVTYLNEIVVLGAFEFVLDDIKPDSIAQATAPVLKPTPLALLAIGILMSLCLKGRRLHTHSHNEAKYYVPQQNKDTTNNAGK
jgi:hypothetical protein